MPKNVNDLGDYNICIRIGVYLGEAIICGLLFYLFCRSRGSDVYTYARLIHSLIITVLTYFLCIINGGVILHSRNVKYYQIVSKTFTNIILFAIISSIILKLGKFYMLPVKHYLLFLVTLFLCSTFFRIWVHYLVKRWHINRSHIRHIVLVGSTENNVALYHELTDDSSMGYEVAGYFDDQLNEELERVGCPYLGKPLDAPQYLHDNPEVKAMYCCLPSSRREEIVQLITYCENNLIHFYSVPNIRNYLYNKVYFNVMGNVPYLSLHKDPLSKIENRIIKRLFDIVFSTLILITIFPIVLLLVCIVTPLTMPGPIFFKQKRNGLNGEEFYCLKFRSMKVNVDSDNLQATKDDPRITRWGKFMRHTNIDELPQFVNVLVGDMSVVGPRPHMLKHTEEYSQLINRYMVRHYVKPGITGWSQVTGYRGETKELSQMEGRILRDIWYVDNWSLGLDLHIILKTVVNIVRGDRQAY